MIISDNSPTIKLHHPNITIISPTAGSVYDLDSGVVNITAEFEWFYCDGLNNDDIESILYYDPNGTYDIFNRKWTAYQWGGGVDWHPSSDDLQGLPVGQSHTLKLVYNFTADYSQNLRQYFQATVPIQIREVSYGIQVISGSGANLQIVADDSRYRARHLEDSGNIPTIASLDPDTDYIDHPVDDWNPPNIQPGCVVMVNKLATLRDENNNINFSQVLFGRPHKVDGDSQYDQIDFYKQDDSDNRSSSQFTALEFYGT